MTLEFIRMPDEHREPQIADTLQERRAILVAFAVLVAGTSLGVLLLLYGAPAAFQQRQHEPHCFAGAPITC